MNISKATGGTTLNASGTTTRPGYAGSVSINAGVQASYPTANQAYQTFFLIAGASSSATLDLTTGDASGDTWVNAVQQVETATVVGSITSTGNISVTITSADLTGSPKEFLVDVENGDNWPTVAAKISNELQYDGTGSGSIGAFYDIESSSGDVIFTRKEKSSYTVGDDTIVLAHANDATLNIAIDNGTATGLTPAPTSSNTTAGVEASGVYIWNDDIDYEGFPLASPSAIHAVCIDHSTENTVGGHTMNYLIGSEYKGRMKATTTQGSNVMLHNPDASSILDTITMTGTDDSGLVVVTVVSEL